MTTAASILSLNAGSSSVRFAIHTAEDGPRKLLAGKIDRIGLPDTTLLVTDATGHGRAPRPLAVADHRSAAQFLLDWLEAEPVFDSVTAIGHRVVHGMSRSTPEPVTPELIEALRAIAPYAPDHLPQAIGLIEVLRSRHPSLPQVVCFDTAFHRTMPRVAKMLPIPRRFESLGVERYGFHGLSYAYLIEELTRLDRSAATGRVILAHLGNGASVAAVSDGKSIDTSMGFTPSAGLMMSTRSGSLDPGLLYYLSQTYGLTAADVQRMVNHESGLLGVSETSSDVRDLLAREDTDLRAAEAVALFCYNVKKSIGAYAAVLGGLDTLVFAGGIGENAPQIRERICAGLGFLGISLDQASNAKNAALISRTSSGTTVRVIHTDEELMIVRSVLRVIDSGSIEKG